jgi:hypothetical protein
MSFTELAKREVFVQGYLELFGWGGLVRRLDMKIKQDDANFRLSTVQRFLISGANLGIVLVDNQLLLDEMMSTEEAQNGLVMVKNGLQVYSKLNEQVEQAGLIAVWAKDMNFEILGNSFLNLLSRQQAGK